MPNKDIIVIGASLGGIEALKTLVRGLPAGFPGSVFVVQHISPDSPKMLAKILSQSGSLPVSYPDDHQPIERGHIYVAPPGHHLLVERERVRITKGPKENHSRPSVDALFRSAAYAYGSSVIGVVLSGMLNDGTAGLWAVKDRGGVAIVQDPDEAIAPSMPLSALQNVQVDYCLLLSEIAPLLVEIAGTPAGKEGTSPMPNEMELEVRIAKEDTAIVGADKLGAPSLYTCPDCGGVLMQINEGDSFRFRCHTGHAYSANSLFAMGEEAIEQNLWSAIRALEEQMFLLRQAAERLNASGSEQEARPLLEMARVVQQKTDIIRKMLMSEESNLQRSEAQAGIK